MASRTRYRVAVFSEVYSENLGDGVIFDCMEEIFAPYGVHAVACDISGRSGWSSDATAPRDERRAHRRLASWLLRRSRFMRRLLNGVMWRLRKSRSRAFEQEIKLADAIIIGGGQLLTDRDWRFPPAILLILNLAKKHKKPIAIFGCGTEILGFRARRIYRKVLNYACYVSVRDAVSRTVLEAIRPTGGAHIDVHPDPVFALSGLPSGDASSQIDCERLLAFNVQPPSHFRQFAPELSGMSDDEYVNFWLRLAAGALTHAERLLLICNGDREDFHFAHYLATKLRLRGLSVDVVPRPTRPHEVIDQYRNVSRLVCTRMHAGIIAASLGVEVAPIVWDKKVDNVWEEFGTAAHVVPAKAILAEDPWSVVARYFQHSPRSRDSLFASADERLRAAAERCVFSLLVNDDR